MALLWWGFFMGVAMLGNCGYVWGVVKQKREREMCNGKWTKGPWEANSKEPMAAAICRVGPVEISTDSEVGDDYADASLIASAPELYEALKACIEGEFACTNKDAIAMAESAMAKARGES